MNNLLLILTRLRAKGLAICLINSLVLFLKPYRVLICIMPPYGLSLPGEGI